METIGFVLAFLKVMSFMRIMDAYNSIMLTIELSGTLLVIFMGALMTFNFALVPLAMSIWATQVAGYKTLTDTLNSLFMIAYSKGDLE